jgi:hypothetical protein
MQSCKKDQCSQSDHIINDYDSVKQIYQTAFQLDLSKKFTYKKYKSDSVMTFTFKSKHSNFVFRHSNTSAVQCSSFYNYYQNISFIYSNNYDEELLINQDIWKVSLTFRNKTSPIWNGDLYNKKYSFDTITLNNNNYFKVFKSYQPYETYLDNAVYYNFEHGFLRLRISLDDFWDLVL